MSIFEITQDKLIPLLGTTFGAEGIYERKDLQRHIKQNIDVLASDLMVVAEEYGEWLDSNRRIDLLCIDREANIVVIEIKRTDDGGHMELQAIRYAAMLSTMTFKQLVDAYASYVAPSGSTHEQAEGAILAFLRWEEPNEEAFGNDIRIVLAAANFSKEVTMSVLWLIQHGIDIRCVRLKPYRLPDRRVLLDVQQIIPLPEVSDFQTQIRAKEQAEREHRAERYDIRHQFWSALLELAKTRTDLHAGRRAGSYGWIGGSTGKAGLGLIYATRGNDSQVELYIDFGDEDKNLRVYQHFKQHSEAISASFGGELDWQDLPDSRGCRIRHLVAGGWRSSKEEWPTIHGNMVDAMIRLEKAFRPYFSSIPL